MLCVISLSAALPDLTVREPPAHRAAGPATLPSTHGRGRARSPDKPGTTDRVVIAAGPTVQRPGARAGIADDRAR